MRSNESPETNHTLMFIILACGFGIHLGWETADISPSLYTRFPETIFPVVDALYYPIRLGSIAVFLICAVKSARYGGLSQNNFFAKTILVMYFLSTFVSYISTWVFNLPAGALIGEALSLSGIVVTLLWSESLAKMSLGKIFIIVCLSHLIQFAICIVLASFKDTPAIIFHAILPLISGALLLYANTNMPHESPLGRISIKKLSGFVKLCLCMGIIGSSIFLVNIISEQKSYPAELCTLLSGCAVSILFLIASSMRDFERKQPLLFRFFVPFTVLCVLLVLVLQSGMQLYEALAIGASWAFFRLLCWFAWFTYAFQARKPIVFIAAVGQAAISGMSLLSKAVFDTLSPELTHPIFLSAIVFALVLAYTLLIGQSSISRQHIDNGPMSIEENARAVAQIYALSHREEEIAASVAKGMNNQEISSKFCIAESTLRTHLRNIYKKTEVHSRSELIALIANPPLLSIPSKASVETPTNSRQ